MVAVLMVTAVLSVLMAAVLTLSRSSGRNALGTQRELTLVALRQAGLELSGYELFVRQVPPDTVDGQVIRFDAGSILLTAETTADRIDLNAADAKLLAAAFKASGAKSMPADAFAARVIDWRDGDDDRGQGGAEAPDYAAAGLKWKPANDAFTSVEDLRWLAGLKAEDLPRLLPYFTVDDPAGKLDVLAAPANILALVPGLNPSVAKRVVALRKDPTPANINAIKGLLGDGGGMLQVGDSAAYRIRLEIRLNGDEKPSIVSGVVIRDTQGRKAYFVSDIEM